MKKYIKYTCRFDAVSNDNRKKLFRIINSRLRIKATESEINRAIFAVIDKNPALKKTLVKAAQKYLKDKL